MNGIALLLLMLALTVAKSGCAGVAGSRSSGGNPPAVTISNPAASSISSTGATITWTTNVPADSQVEYGTTSSYGQSTPVDPSALTTHTVNLSGLTSSTLYHYRVKSRDAAGNLATSGDFTFSTASSGTGPSVSITAPGNGATVSGTVTVMASASSDVVAVQFLVDGANLNTEATTAPYSTSWDSTRVANGTHTLSARARTGSGATATASNVSVLVSNAGGSSPADTITIFDTSGTTQTNRPVSVGRGFRQGDIPNFAQAVIGGTQVTTQVDARNRWPDGSLKYAVVSFIVPSIPANGSVTVQFANQGTGNNTGFLQQADMLAPAYNFDAQIQMVGATSRTVNARTILSAGACGDTTATVCRYWLKGPVVTAVILEDRNPTRTYDVDFGDGSKALHPIFEAWFYPANNSVYVGYAMENIWASSTASQSMRDLSYSVTLTAGNTTPQTRYSQGTFNHIGRSRWHKRFWVGSTPPGIRIDHNLAYWASTGIIPNWDTSIVPVAALIDSRATATDSSTQVIEGAPLSIGDIDKDLNQPGATDWVGPAATWDVLWLYSFDDRLLRVSLGNADLASRIPYFFREADQNAGTGMFFDRPVTGSVSTFGRVVSVNARQQVTLQDLVDYCGGIGADQINTGTITNDGWGALDPSHAPVLAYIPYLFSGRYYYLEEIQMEAAYWIGFQIGCSSQTQNRQGAEGFFNGSQERGDAWSLHTVVYAAIVSPDGTPEKAYFEDKLKNNLAEWEGFHNITLDIPGKQTEWNFGNGRAIDPRGVSPLGFWVDRGTAFVSAELRTVPPPPIALGACSPFEQNFIMNGLGLARKNGYPTRALLQFGAIRLVNQAFNTDTFPELIEPYRSPVINSNNLFISTWPEFNSYFLPNPNGLPISRTCAQTDANCWRQDEAIDHSYGFIAMAALSYMADLTVTVQGVNKTGLQAWDLFKTLKPLQSRFASCVTPGPSCGTPKWAIVPVGRTFF